MKLFVIRHTRVAVEPEICYGQSDVSVADSFDEEKVRVANLVANIQFGNIYSSPLTRCKLLAEGLFQKEQIIFDDRLKELNFGDWELKTWDEIYTSSEGKVWMDNYQSLPTLNGESYPEMVKRVTEFLNEIRELQIENTAVVVHAGVIRIFKSLIDEESIEELFNSFNPAYGSVTEFEI
jgi:alpha-ribazole phosphatase